MDEKLIARFWRHVDKNGPTPAHRPKLGPCWVWTAYTVPGGYGRFSVTPRHTELAHRQSWLITHGRWPESCALHHCDNPRCVRPDHLFEGTRLDNIRDMHAKGRGSTGRGERCGISKLTESQVRQVRASYAGGGVTMAELANEYRCCHATISNIVTRATWKHVT